MNKTFSTLAHIGILTNDIENTIYFYKKLGFKIVFKTELNKKKIIFLQYKDLCIELCETDTIIEKNNNINHFAISVNDLDNIYHFLKKENFKILTDGIETLPFFENGIKYFIIEGVNGEKIEFSQTL